MDISCIENYKKLKAIVSAIDVDFEKFQNKKVKASGNRVRNNLLNVKKLCDELRKQIQNEMKKLPTKHRISKTSKNDDNEDNEDNEDKS